MKQSTACFGGLIKCPPLQNHHLPNIDIQVIWEESAVILIIICITEKHFFTFFSVCINNWLHLTYFSTTPTSLTCLILHVLNQVLLSG